MTDTTRLSSKGQIVIPKHLRDTYRWETGQELVVVDTGDGVLLRAQRSFPLTKLEEVAGSLLYEGSPKSVEEMDAAIGKGVAENHDRG